MIEPEHREPPAKAELAPLFRAKAVSHQQTMWLGTVMLSSRGSHSVMALFALATIGMFVLLPGSSYTSTARVGGLLVSDRGLIRIFVPQGGILMNLRAREGDNVTEGSPLLIVST